MIAFRHRYAGILQDIGAGINWFGNCVDGIIICMLYLPVCHPESHRSTKEPAAWKGEATLHPSKMYTGTRPERARNVLCQHDLFVIFVSTTLRQLVVLHD